MIDQIIKYSDADVFNPSPGDPLSWSFTSTLIKHTWSSKSSSLGLLDNTHAGVLKQVGNQVYRTVGPQEQG